MWYWLRFTCSNFVLSSTGRNVKILNFPVSKSANNTKLCGCCAGGKGWQAWEVVCENFMKNQQGQVQDPATRLGQSQAWIQTEQRLEWEQPCREGLGGADGGEAGHDPATCTCHWESQMCPGLHLQQCGQQGEGGGFCSALLCSALTPSVVLHPALGSLTQEGRGFPGKSCWDHRTGVPL